MSSNHHCPAKMKLAALCFIFAMLAPTLAFSDPVPQSIEVDKSTPSSAGLSSEDANASSPLRIEVNQYKKFFLPKMFLTWRLLNSSTDGTVEEMQEDIAAGADVNAPFLNFYDFTPLTEAIRGERSSLEKVKILLANGADPNIFHADVLSALYGAVSDRNIEITRILLEAGANANGTTGISKTTALQEAASKHPEQSPKEQQQMIKLLMKFGAKSRPLESVRDPLCGAVLSGAGPEVVSLLLEAGSLVNDSEFPDSTTGRTPLMCAMLSSSDPESVKALLAAGADWRIRDHNGKTVFDYLKKNDSPRAEVIRKILMTEKLVSLVADGSVEEVEKAIAQGADVNLANAFQTPLMAAGTDTELGVAKAQLLLAAGADPNGHNGDRMTPLQTAAARDNIGMVRLLLKEGAEVNAVDSLGRTALWETLHQGRMRCGKSPPIPEGKCLSLDLQKQIVDLLLKAGAVAQPNPSALKALWPEEEAGKHLTEVVILPTKAAGCNLNEAYHFCC